MPNFPVASQSARPAASRTSRLLWLLWLCFLVRGCVYSAILPMWEGYDEPFHFSFIQYVAAHWSLPQASTPVSREVQASLHVAPLSWEQRLHAMEGPVFTHDSFWQVPRAERERLERELRAIPPEWGRETGSFPLMYEAQQAPLYYWLMALPLRLTSSWSLPARVLLVRLLSVLLASLLVPIAYLAAKEFSDPRADAVGVVAVLVCLPELMIDVCRAGNESLAVVVYSLLALLLLLAARSPRPAMFTVAGLALGLGLLTKAYFVLAIPAFVAVAIYSAIKHRGAAKRVVSNAAAGLAMALLISLPWYWRNHVLTGTWSGEENNVAAMHGGVAHLLASAAHVKWAGGITSILVSHIWFGAWSFLKLPKPVYLVLVLAIAFATLGVVRGTWRDRLRSPALFVVLAAYVFFWLGLLYDILLVFVATGVSASDGWYLYALVVPELLLLAYGFRQLLPAHAHRVILPAAATAFAAIDLYGAFALLVPYYTGLIAHVPGSDRVRAASLSLLLHTAPQLVLSRLTTNKPDILSQGAFALLIALYGIATITAAACAYWAALADGHLRKEMKTV